MSSDPSSPWGLTVLRARWLGHGLVSAQFGLMAWLGLLVARSSPAGSDAGVATAIVLILGGAGLGLWALTANRPGNFNIHPAPRPGARLVVHGPYRWIRHPMYAALLLLTAAAALLAASPAGALAWALLLAVLALKAILEERWLAAHHDAYALYCRDTWRLLPRVF